MNLTSWLSMTMIGVIVGVFVTKVDGSPLSLPKLPELKLHQIKLPQLQMPVLAMPSSVMIPPPSLILAKKTKIIPVAPAVNGGDVKIGDGDIVGKKLYIYKCKICDMPRMFKMKYGSFIF